MLRWKHTLDTLREQEPLLFPVHVSRRKLKDGLQGYCKISKISPLTLSIVVDRRLSELLQADVLIHEWAHGLMAPLINDFHEHGALWGVMYARCFVAAYGD